MDNWDYPLKPMDKPMPVAPPSYSVELTDEGVWLRLYCAILTCGFSTGGGAEKADAALVEFKKRWRKDESK